MSSVQVTPRKRKVSNGSDGPSTSTTRKGRSQGLPTPNPPLAPFPTPPSSRHRSTKPSSSLDDTIPPSDTPAKRRLHSSDALPPHLQSLLNLHHAFNLAISLHIATHPPVLPPHPPSATSLQLTNLTNLLAIKGAVERTSGRRFAAAELGRLAWIWQWDGEALPSDKTVSEKRKAADELFESDNPFLVASDRPSQVSGLGYVVTPTRTLENGRKVATYGLGIELSLKKGETRQILHGGHEGGMGNAGQGGGTAAVGRWSAGGEARQAVFRDRLDKWVELNGGWEPPVQAALPTPTSSSNERSTIPPIPILPLPHLPSSTLLPAANLFGSTSTLSTSASPKKLTTPAGLADPFVLDESKGPNKVVHNGSVEARKQAMLERIKARSKPTQTLGSSLSAFPLKGASAPLRHLSSAETQDALARRSTLSRLESVAEGVWMMFSSPSPGPSTLPTPPRGRRKAIPMGEVAEVIVKSSKTPISLAEAHTSLQLLTELCPFFLTAKTIAKQDWLEMPAHLANSACPPSPSSSPSAGALSARTMPTLPHSPSPSESKMRAVPAAPGSPSPSGRRVLESPSSPVSAGLVGSGSPGRVRRVGGLREVRERIRRELGE